ncbi:hypothetical protein [Secundilactobacillus collinoides]|uniref:hypothetical protein n=1 Tax=Secundilactobacillus collinoides TaxID=33960 RepID=UPI000AD5EA2D
MMIAITILGAGLLAKKNRIPKIFGVFALLIASQFHDLGFVFLLVIVPLSLIKLDTLIRYYKYFVFFLYGVAAFFMVNSDGIVINFFASFLSKFSSRDNSADNVLTSFGRGSSHSTIIFVWILLLLFSLVLTMFVKLLRKLNTGDENKIKLLFIGSASAMLVVFLIVIAPDYSRISRNAFLFLIIMLCSILEKKVVIHLNQKNIEKAILVVFLFTFTAYVNTSIWGSTYYESIPYLAKLEK